MRNVEQIITDMINLSKEAMIASLFWGDIVNRCERYLVLIGVANFDKLKADLNDKLYEIESKKFNHCVHRFKKLIEELNNHG